MSTTKEVTRAIHFIYFAHHRGCDGPVVDRPPTVSTIVRPTLQMWLEKQTVTKRFHFGCQLSRQKKSRANPDSANPKRSFADWASDDS